MVENTTDNSMTEQDTSVRKDTTDYTCPKCGGKLVRLARKDSPEKHFWGCDKFYSDECRFLCDDVDGVPFLRPCPECGENLSRKISKKSGKPYIVCFNKAGHSSKEVVFYNEDGSPKRVKIAQEFK